MAVNLSGPVRGPLRFALAASLVAASLGDGRAADGTPPPRWERLAEIVAPTLRGLEQLRRSGTPGLPDPRILVRCAERAQAAVGACTRGRRPAALGCAARLRAIAIALDAAADRSTDAGTFVAYVAADTARLATLVGTLERSRVACAEPEPDTSVPAVLGWRAGGTRLEVEPARPLAPGRRHRLVIAPDVAITATEPALDPGGRLSGGPETTATVPLLADYHRRVSRDAARAPGVTTRPTLTLRLEHPVPLPALTSMTAAFHPIDAKADADGIVVTTVGGDVPIDAPSATGSPHAGTRAIGSDERETLGLAPASPDDAELRLGTFASRDPATSAPREVPYVVAVPPARTHPDVVVLLLDGLGGDATRFLRIRGASLLAEGLTLAAMDLPAHGMRADGLPFLDAHDPSVLARRLATAVADVLALVAHLRTTAAIAPDVPPPTTVRVLGYSIGAAVASVALALDPTLGAAVLISPPGDLSEFLILSTSAASGEPLLRCMAAGRMGPPCGGDVACADGACILNPVLLPLLESRTATRTVLAAVDPQTRARAIAGSNGTRPVLLQLGGRDGIVAPEGTLWLAAALGADLTCARRATRPQALCRFADAGHDLVWRPVARRQADAFLASDGAVLAPSGDAFASR